jgi:hypothetical protein
MRPHPSSRTASGTAAVATVTPAAAALGQVQQADDLNINAAGGESS